MSAATATALSRSLAKFAPSANTGARQSRTQDDLEDMHFESADLTIISQLAVGAMTEVLEAINKFYCFNVFYEVYKK